MDSNDCTQPSVPRSAEALKRKRERDRQHQRRKRQQTLEQVAALKQRVCQLEQELVEANRHIRAAPGSPRPSLSHSRIDESTEISSRLSTPQPAAAAIADIPSNIVSTLSPTQCTAISTASGRENYGVVSGVTSIAHLPATSSSHRVWSSPQSPRAGRKDSPSPDSSAKITISSEALGVLLATPDCLRFPQLTFARSPGPRLLVRNDVFGPILERLRATSNVAVSCPATPKPLDLLFGGSRNELANFIASEIVPHYFLPPERFAISWHLYLYLRWLIVPSPDSFSAVPEWMHPTPCQLVMEHPIHLVAIPWARLRDNLVLNWRKYNLEQVFSLLSSTSRIRGAFNAKFITRKDEDEPQVDAVFYQSFMREDGWGILEPFWTEYPGLVEGLSRKVLIREEHLLPTGRNSA